MLRNFFAAPDFLRLLRFWESRRGGAALADWDGDVSAIPAELLPNLIILDELPDARYRYVGAACTRRFGGDTTGRKVAETLGPAYGGYIRSLIEDALLRRAPVFSASVLQIEPEVMLTGRLFAPFALRGSPEPRIVMSAHFFSEGRFRVKDVGAQGSVLETERLLIAAVPEICARLEEARRYHHLSRATPDPALAREWDRIAVDLGAGALVALPTYPRGDRRDWATQG